ncbi:unnamed protein product [Oppiella nova]|uniref:Uncharacterized protein n=1 Tax=Oppiella nova TaxID=334625 RepID=A0A7R9MCA8_9ACAR|nr:unnamed protein product [Oppiella nova]CAG2173477.1 unnamed protein product [Oppiella nova]
MECNKIVLPLEDDVDTSLAWAFVLGDVNRLISPKDKLFQMKCEQISGEGNPEKLNKIREYFELKFSGNAVLGKIFQTQANKALYETFCGPIISGKCDAWKEYNEKVEKSAKYRENMMDALMEANKTSTSMTMARLLCLLKLYKEDTIDMHSEKRDARGFVRAYFAVFNDIISTLEDKVTKAATSCSFKDIPKPTALPPQSLYLALVAAINNLTSKITDYNRRNGCSLLRLTHTGAHMDWKYYFRVWIFGDVFSDYSVDRKAL